MANDIANGQTVADIQEMMRDAGFGLKHLPIHLEILLKEEAWKHRVIKQTGKVAEFDRFEDFVEANLCAGLESSVDQLKRLCSDNVPVLDLIDHAVQNPNGVHNRAVDNSNSIERPTGTTRANALRRLRTQRPDLHTKVLKGDLSPHSAMIEAGFREKKIEIAVDPERAARIIKKYFNEDQIASLIDHLMR
jgi:hypothetical protein